MRSRGHNPITAIGVLVAMLLVAGSSIPLFPSDEKEAKSPKQMAVEAEATARPRSSFKDAPAPRLEAAPAPRTPLVVLYDQTSSINLNSTSQNFEAAYDAYDNQGADDFVVAAANGWNVTAVFVPGGYSTTHGTPSSMRVAFYQNAAGVPGAPICDYPALPFTEAPVGSFTINLPGGCVLSPGSKWVSIVANMNFGGGGGQWFWSTRTVLSGNPSKWQNPGGGFATPCTTWGTRSTCLSGNTDPDFAFRLDGNVTSCMGDPDCSDGNACDGVETCSAGTCIPGIPIDCSDNQFCTIESCDPPTGICSSRPNSCTDGNSCTVDSCDEATDTCTHLAPPLMYFCNSTPIVIPATGTAAGVAAPYPSSIVLSGLPTVGSVCTVSLIGMNHTWEGDVDVMLVSPLGGASNRTIMSDVGGNGDFINTGVTLTDGAANSLPTTNGNIASGTYKPTNNGAIDTFDAPAPEPTGLATLSGFDGINPNGTWNLFVRDDASGDIGNFSGWCLGVVVANCTNNGQCQDGNACDGVETCVGGSCFPGTPIVCDDGLFCTVEACIPESGTCTHTPSSCDDGNICTADSCDEANNACINTNTCVSFCNSDGIALNDSNGAPPPAMASPYPSLVTVTGMGSSVSVAQVRLLGLTHTFPDDLDVLLVSPVDPSINATIMSDVGGSADVAAINLTLSDGAATPLPDGGPLVSGTFRPNNVDTTSDPFLAPAPVASGASALSTFGSVNQNGTWSLYVIDDANQDSGTLAGWCLDMIPSGCVIHADCNDGNPCTVDLCNAGACAHNPDDGAACDDGDVCTDSGHCAGGVCQPGPPRNCDDGNPCTTDSCVQPTGCQSSPVQRPGEVGSLTLGTPNKQTVSWSGGEPASSLYDLVRGNLGALPAGPMGDDEVCLGDINATTTTDPQIPIPGRGFWYLVRGVGCDAGPYGQATAGPRETATCDDLDLASPAEGEVVNEGALVVARVPPALVPFIEWIHFEYSANGTLWNRIVGVAPDDTYGYQELWHATPVAPGSYGVRGIIKLFGRAPFAFPSTPRHVIVNAQPHAQITITACQTDPGPPMIGFSAASSSDPDGGIVSFHWDFGDGTTGTGVNVTHVYSTLGQYSVALTTVDAYNAPTTTFALVTADVANNCAQEAKTSCGCASMDVKSANAVEGPAGYEFEEGSSGIPPAEKGNLGPYNDGVAGALPAQLDMTKASFTVSFRFEVIATLKPKSKPQLCTEGQRVKRTSTYGGPVGGPADQHKKNGPRTSDARYDSGAGPDDPYQGDPPDNPAATETVDCPTGGADWCDDDYHGGGGTDGAGSGDNDPPNLYKKYDGQTKILWLDAPGFTGFAKGDITNNGVTKSCNFESKVSGPLGTCTCTFDVNIEIDNTGKVTKNELVNKSCSSSFASRDDILATGEIHDVRQVLDLQVNGDDANPDAPVIRFGYTLADPKNVEIRIVDAAGRTIRTLESGSQPAGENVTLWDRRDDAGSVVPEGSYRYIARIGTWEREGRLGVSADDGK